MCDRASRDFGWVAAVGVIWVFTLLGVRRSFGRVTVCGLMVCLLLICCIWWCGIVGGFAALVWVYALLVLGISGMVGFDCDFRSSMGLV